MTLYELACNNVFRVSKINYAKNISATKTTKEFVLAQIKEHTVHSYIILIIWRCITWVHHLCMHVLQNNVCKIKFLYLRWSIIMQPGRSTSRGLGLVSVYDCNYLKMPYMIVTFWANELITKRLSCYFYNVLGINTINWITWIDTLNAQWYTESRILNEYARLPSRKMFPTHNTCWYHVNTISVF